MAQGFKPSPASERSSHLIAAGGYFDKLGRFCFSKQQPGPHEMADMPVVFFLDPALENDRTMNAIDTVTLRMSRDRDVDGGCEQGKGRGRLS
jgi:hypothetical protein